MAQSTRLLAEAQWTPAAAFHFREMHRGSIQFALEDLCPLNLLVYLNITTRWLGTGGKYDGPVLTGSGFYAGRKPWPLQPRHVAHGRVLDVFGDLVAVSEREVLEKAKTPQDAIITFECTLRYHRAHLEVTPAEMTSNVTQVYAYNATEKAFYLDV